MEERLRPGNLRSGEEVHTRDLMRRGFRHGGRVHDVYAGGSLLPSGGTPILAESHALEADATGVRRACRLRCCVRSCRAPIVMMAAASTVCAATSPGN